MHDDPAAGTEPQVPGSVEAGGALDPGVPWRASGIGDDHSPNAAVCPFLRAIDENDALGVPVAAPDPANRCAALRDAVPQSLRQQELVCLTIGHLNCPRYLRGSLATSHRVKPVPASRTLTPTIAGSLIVLALAFLLSLGFVLANGGLLLTAAGPTPTGTGSVLGEVETAAPTAAPTVAPTASPTPEPTPGSTPSPSPSATPSPSPSASPTPTPSPTPSATPTPKPTSNRFALLKPCPDAPNCYIYIIRSGDNLYSIANYFGVSLAKVQAMNPWTANGLTVGRGLRIPTPTR